MALPKVLGWLIPEESRVWRKLAMIALTLLVPVVVLAYLLLSTNAELATFARQEIAGTDYLNPVRKLTVDLLQHRSMADAYLRDPAVAKKSELKNKQEEIEADLKAVDLVDQRLGAALQAGRKNTAFTTKDWPTLRGDILNLFADNKILAIKSEESYKQHTAVVAALVAMFANVGESSNLLFDPVLESYYLMDTMLYRIPVEADFLVQSRDLAVGIAARKKVTAEERNQLQLLAGQRRAIADIVAGNQTSLVRANEALGTKLAGAAKAHLTASDEFIQLVRTKIIDAPGNDITVTEAELADGGNRAVASSFRLYEDSEPDLKRLLQGRLDKTQTATYLGIVAIVGGVLLALGLAYLVTRNITRQVGSITDMFSQIGMGNFQARADVITSDELGQMAGGLNVMLDNTLSMMQSQDEKEQIQTSIEKLLDEVKAVASGDLTKEAAVATDITGPIASSVNHMLEQFRKVIGNVQDATLQVSSSANEIQATAEHVAQGSEAQAEQIVNTSAAIDEMAVSVQQVSENAAASAQVAQQALVNAKQGNHAVQNTIGGMNRIRDQVQETAKRIKRLGESSQEIGQIIQLIDDIADRTSILALNASIQAAMAGEAGRGFAVVAEEVERLAVRSTDATKKIGSLVKTIQSETTEAVAAMEKGIHEVVDGSKLANEAGQSLGQIEGVSQQLAELIQSISLASKQQARGAEALAKSMGEISQITQQTAAGTKQAAVSVSDLASLADELRESVSTFKLPGQMEQPNRAKAGNGLAAPREQNRLAVPGRGKLVRA